MTNKPHYFVTRSIDNAILGKDGRWMKQFADAGDIKFYSSIGRAQKFGIGRIPGSMYKDELGNTRSIGTCHAVYPDETVNIVGHVHDADGKRICHRGTANPIEVDTASMSKPEALMAALLKNNVRPAYANTIVKYCHPEG